MDDDLWFTIESDECESCGNKIPEGKEIVVVKSDKVTLFCSYCCLYSYLEKLAENAIDDPLTRLGYTYGDERLP